MPDLVINKKRKDGNGLNEVDTKKQKLISDYFK